MAYETTANYLDEQKPSANIASDFTSIDQPGRNWHMTCSIYKTKLVIIEYIQLHRRKLHSKWLFTRILPIWKVITIGFFADQ